MLSISFTDYYRWRNFCFPHALIYSILISIITGFVILTIIFGSLWLKCDPKQNPIFLNTTTQIFNCSNSSSIIYAIENGIIGFPPILPNDENKNTIKFLAGDLVSSLAIGTVKINRTILNGKQMIATMNSLGLDYITFDNHEFDLNESTFTWISSNVFHINTTQSFGISIPYKLITIEGVRMKYTPIYKTDANVFTVYIHRCAFNIDKKQFRIYSTLARVSSDIPEEEKTAKVTNYWFNLGIQGFQTLETLSYLPSGIELDGRYESVTSTITLLTEVICDSLIYITKTSETTIALINDGTIRIDDFIRETITQYDILRTLPFPNQAIALSIPGEIIAQVLTTGISVKVKL